jgi:hypothetical protein
MARVKGKVNAPPAEAGGAFTLYNSVPGAPYKAPKPEDVLCCATKKLFVCLGGAKK